MYYNSRKKLRFVAFISILIIIWCVIFLIDYFRVNKNLSPIFVIKTIEYENGEEEKYCALYKVNKYIVEGKTKYELGFITLKFNPTDNVDIYVEPYKETDSINIYVEPYKEFESVNIYAEW